MRSAALRACIIRGAEPYRPNQRRSARHPYRSRTIAARCAALILRAPLLIRLRFASDPSGWRPRYHPLRFARIIRDAPRRAARDTRTASITPVPARRPELRIRRFNPRLPGGRRPHTEKPGPRARRPLARIVARAPTSIPAHTALRAKRFAPDSAQNAPETTRSPVRTRSRADASQKPYRARAVRWRVWWRAHRPAYQTAPHSAPALRARRRPERTRSHQKPGTRQNQPEALPRARRLVARVVARAPTSIPDRDSVTRRRFAPFQSTPSRGKATAPEPARSPYRARAVRWRVRWRAHRPAYQPAPTLRARSRPERARSQPQAPTARYFASARSPTRSGFDCDARALRNCNSTRPSCARRRRRSASVIGCGRPAWSHRMHSSFVRVGFSFLLHVHAGRYGCSASGFHSLTSSRSRNRSSSVRE